MDRLLNPFSRTSASLNVDIDSIDTDDECEEDELNIGWDGGADNINGRPLTEADVDSNALPAGTSAPADDDEEDDNFEEPLFVDESGNVVRAAATVGDGDDEGGDGFYDAMEEWDADYHGDDDESPNDDDAAGDEEEDRRVEEEAIADSAGTTGQPQQKKQKTPAEVRYKTVEIPDSILASLIS